MRRSTKLLQIVFVTIIIMANSTPSNADEGNIKYCRKMEKGCRLTTQWKDIEGYRYTSMNISCYCDEDEDVWDELEKLSTSPCSFVPVDDSMKVNLSTIHITGCNVKKQVFPQTILTLARRTDNLEIVFDKCPYIRLGQIVQKQRKVHLLKAYFTDSMLSGLPRGWLKEADELQAFIKRCQVSVIESKAISGFSEDSKVQIEFIDTNISTVKMLAFELPPYGSLSIKGGNVTLWEKNGNQGGSNITVEDVRLGMITKGAFNLFGVQSFRMVKCLVAELMPEVVIETNKRQMRSYQNRTTREAVIMHNIFMKASGNSLASFCDFPSLIFRNNTFVMIIYGPIKLQDENCKTDRNWRESIKLIGQDCTNCDSFTELNEQSCAFYRSGYCSSCNQTSDSCDELLLPYLTEKKCPQSHPQLVQELKDICQYDPEASRFYGRSLNSAQTVMVASKLFISSTIVVLLSLNLHN